jgi:diguanylate cyclase (GGDEF)-like protein
MTPAAAHKVEPERADTPRVALPVTLPRPSTWTTVLWLVGVPLAAAVTLLPAASFLVRIATATAAAGVMLTAARRRPDGLARSRRFFAAALLVGAASGLVSVAYALVNGEVDRTGWLAHWVHLSYAPLAVVGVLVIPRASGSLGSRVRELSDGAVAAGALWYLSRVLIFDNPDLAGQLIDGADRLVAVTYPVVPAFVVAMFLSAIPRATPEGRRMLSQMAVGMTLLGASSAALSVTALSRPADPVWWIAALNEMGLLVILRAALVRPTPARARAQGEPEAALDATRGLLVIGAPFVPLVVAMVAATYQFAAGRGIPPAQTLPVLLVGTAVLVRHVAGARETAQLVSSLAARERAARTVARTDALTGLANRTAFVAELDAALRDPAAHPVAVALLDLNDFKDINDTHGHDTGDDVLRHTADRLCHAVPDGGVARLGGDEFAAFVRASPDNGRSLAEEIADAFAEPVRVGKRRFQVRPSVGVVVDERPVGAARTGDASHLLAHADVAMYEAKGSKTVTDVPIAVLTGRARAAAAATIRIREEISTPDLSQFRVEYQPVVDLQTGEIAGAEALLRWRHPGFGDISPATFIPLAERVGSIGVLGEHVLTTALDDLVRFQGTGPALTVGVNVSPRQLTDPSLARTVARMLAERHLAPAQLSLEVTEEALVDDLEPVVETIAALRAGGISVAVDDFGTGYSSLRYLRRFDANIVKIDREFVQASSTEPRTDALVRSVMSMAAALGLDCVAEGIETLEQLALVRSHGCRYGQGFLLARPMRADALGELVAAGHVYPVDVAAPRQTEAPASAGDADVLPMSRRSPDGVSEASGTA